MSKRTFKTFPIIQISCSFESLLTILICLNRFNSNVYKMATSQIAVIMAGLKIPINFRELHYQSQSITHRTHKIHE